MKEALLRCQNLSIRVPGRDLVRNLSLDIRAGEFICMLGPNGVGKTLALHAIAGLRPVPRDTILCRGTDLHDMPRRQVAQSIGLLLQDEVNNFPTRVYDAALMGRHPHIPLFGTETRQDHDITRRALADVGLTGLEERQVTTLSGGERRRLGVARLLAQDPAVLLLDEPVNHLDPRHQVRILGRLRELTDQDKAVMISLHDPALAVRIACTVLLMFGDGHWLIGPARHVVTAENLERLFGTEYQPFHTQDDEPVLLPRVPRRTARIRTA